MKVVLGEKGLDLTWQETFPKETECCRCKGVARIGFVAYEESGEDKYICNLHSNEGKGGYWPHDTCNVAVYFCKECLEPTALYNQA